MILSKEQEVAIDHFQGPALVLAVPGAGKTTVLIHRTYSLIKNHNISPERILSITFSKTSAKDMKERFNHFFPQISSIPVNFSTIHSFCYNLLREYAYIKRIKYTLIEEEKNQLNKYSLLKKIYLDLNQEYITEDKLETLINLIGYIKNMMISPEEFLKDNKTDIDNFKAIYDSYEEYKRKNDLIDFDDMLSLSYKIFLEDKGLLEKYRHKFDFIQVDEGQDTSKIQMEIIKLLGLPKNNIFIVADDDQSIYGFRGAYPKGLLDFNLTYPKGRVFFMEQNYRSSKNIVSLSNKFIKANTSRYNKDIFTANGYQEPISIVKVDNTDKQYEYLLEELKEKDLSTVSILYRNNLSAVGLIELFDRYKVPFYMKDSKTKFFNHWMIKDFLDFINFSKNPHDIGIYENIYYKKKGYISKKQVNFAKTLSYNLPVFERLLDFPGLSSFYKSNIRDLTLEFKKLSKLSPLKAIEFIEKDLEYERYLKENSAKFGYTYENLRTMIYYLKLIAQNTKDFDDFFQRLNYLKYISSNSKNKNKGLTLSTVHSAKGLEFEKVYLIDLIDGDFPSLSSIEATFKGNMDLIEEERRLFYVAMTRAKSSLTLITLNSINNRDVDPSRFLLELENKSQAN